MVGHIEYVAFPFIPLPPADSSKLMLTASKLSMTLTANGKNETFAVSIRLFVQYRVKLFVFAMNSRRGYSNFCVLYLRI